MTNTSNKAPKGTKDSSESYPQHTTTLDTEIEKILFTFIRETDAEVPYATDKPRAKAHQSITTYLQQEIDKARIDERTQVIDELMQTHIKKVDAILTSKHRIATIREGRHDTNQNN